MNAGNSAIGMYKAHAQTIYGLGLSPIPIAPKSKKPISSLSNWSGYCDNLPSQALLYEWTEHYPNCGIGVCTGREIRPNRRFAAVDIDDELWRAPLRALFGQPIYAKRGKKGETFFVLAEKHLKSTSLRDANGKQVIDVLIGGRQTVLPPTLHPDTGKPYRWLGKPLWEIDFDELPILDERKLTIMRQLVSSEEALELLGSGGDHGNS